MSAKTKKNRSKFLYLLTGTATGYDVWHSCVVVAHSVEDARKIHPSGKQSKWNADDCHSTWAKQEDVKVKCLGLALTTLKMGSVVCADFHAG